MVFLLLNVYVSLMLNLNLIKDVENLSIAFYYITYSQLIYIYGNSIFN